MYRAGASRPFMKRLLLVLVLVIALAAGGGALYYARLRGAAALPAVGYLPPDTLALLAIPNPGQTAERWKTADLYKIWAEPDVQAFLAKPLGMIPPDQVRTDTLAQIARIQPKNVFIALTALDDKTNEAHLLAGFQFEGASSDVDHLLAPAKDDLRQRYPAGKADLVNYQGHPVETFATGSGTTVASVYLGSLYLIANDLALLEATIDRIEHRVTAPALDKDADFQAVSAKLPPSYDTLIFSRARPVIDRVLALSAVGGHQVTPEDRAEAEKGRALGATTKIENGKLRDTIYYLAPGLRQDQAHLQLRAMTLTSADTLLFYTAFSHALDRLDLSAQDDSASSVPLPYVGMILRTIRQQLRAKGITIEAARASLGAEPAFQLDWPADHSQPTVLWSVDVKDPTGASKLVDALTSIPAGDATWEVRTAGAVTLHVLTVPNLDAIRPTIAVTGKSLILGLNAASVTEAAAREQGAAPNFSQSATYKTAVAEVEKPNVSFCYLDSGTLFERVYGIVKPAALLGAAFLYPKANDYVNLSKLPPVEAITRHLSPTVMSATLDPQGELIESVGSITLFQAGALLASGGAAVAMPMLESRFGALLPHGATAVPAPFMPPTPPAQPGASH
jgi:hypothetical protein